MFSALLHIIGTWFRIIQFSLAFPVIHFHPPSSLPSKMVSHAAKKKRGFHTLSSVNFLHLLLNFCIQHCLGLEVAQLRVILTSFPQSHCSLETVSESKSEWENIADI